MSGLTYLIRHYTDNDEAVVHAAWKNTLSHSAAGYKWAGRDVVYARYNYMLPMLIRHKNVMIACDNDDKDLVLGYICCEPGLLHFAYTKSTYRQQGIMRRLLKESGFKYGDVIKCTHWSDCWEQIIAQRYKVQYTPSELKLRSHNDD